MRRAYAPAISLAISTLAVFFAPASTFGDDKDTDPFMRAEVICTSWLKNEASAKILNGKKITADTMKTDFAEIKKVVLADNEFDKRFVAKFYPDDTPKGAEDATGFIVAVWFEWRVRESKGGLKSLMADLPFAKVRFKSEPKATVFVDAMERGTTTTDLYLGVDGRFQLKMTAKGYKDWEQKDYQPKGRGEIINEKLQPIK